MERIHHNKKSRKYTCEEDADGEVAKDYAGIGAKSDKSTGTTTARMEATYRIRNEGKVSQSRRLAR